MWGGVRVGLVHEALFRIGMTPWVQPLTAFDAQIDTLLGEVTLPTGTRHRQILPGRALGVGCGTGEHAVALARRGWRVVGVDTVAYALERARRRAALSGVEIDFHNVDVCTVEAGGVFTSFDLIVDVGCYHGLDDARRRDYVERVTRLAEPGTSLLMYAFGAGHRGFFPSGASHHHVERRFGDGWSFVCDWDADTTEMSGPFKKVDPRWFRLVRR